MKNEKGVTLVEILGVLVILGISFALIFNILASSQKEYKRQDQQIKSITQSSYILKQITRDLRNTNSVQISSTATGVIYTFKENADILVTYTYESSSKLYRDSELIASDVQDFLITTTTSNTVMIYFIQNEKIYETTISLRRGRK